MPTIDAPQNQSNIPATTLEQYDADGYLIVRGLYSATEIAAIRETFMQQAEQGPTVGLSDILKDVDPNDPLTLYPRMLNPHRHTDKKVGTVALEFLLAPRLEGILTSLLGEEPLAAQSMFYFKPPGARGQALHQDNLYLRVQPGTCLAAWLAVDDVDEENGGMKVVIGTHREEIVCPEEADPNESFTAHLVPVPEGKQAVHLNMKAGDVLFFNGSLIHGSTPNTSKNRFRCSLISHYVPRSCEEVAGYYKPLLSFAQHEVAKLSAEGGGPCGVVVGSPH